MTPQLAFYRFELRRQLLALIISCLFLLALPIVSALRGSWPYWQGEEGEFLTSLVPFLLAPFVACWFAAHGWANDRSQRTLEWLLARPLLPFQLFRARLLAVVTLVAIWFAVACLLMLPMLRAGGGLQGGLYYILFITLSLGIAFGSFFSAVFERPGSALLASLGTLYLFWIVFVVLIFRMLLTPFTRAVAASTSHNLATNITIAVEVLFPAGILILATWAMVRICPGDSRRIVRGLRVLGLGGLAFVAFLLALVVFF